MLSFQLCCLCDDIAFLQVHMPENKSWPGEAPWMQLVLCVFRLQTGHHDGSVRVLNQAANHNGQLRSGQDRNMSGGEDSDRCNVASGGVEMQSLSLGSGSGNVGQVEIAGGHKYGLSSMPSVSTSTTLPVGLELDMCSLSITAAGSDQFAARQPSVPTPDAAAAVRNAPPAATSSQVNPPLPYS